jgi:hypothetical protein
MPRLNYGTLLENIVVLEATRLCLDQIDSEERLAFASAFAMPPLTQCWCRPADERNSQLFTHQFLLLLSEQLHPPQTLQQMWSLCMRNSPHLPVQNYLKDEPNHYGTGGPNGALLAAMLAAQRSRAMRLWVNDDAERYGAGLVKTHVQAGLLAGVQADGTTSDVGGAFPHTIPALRDWLCAGHDRTDSIRVGFLDPDNYAEGLSQVTPNDHQRWLRALANDCGRVLSVMFSGCQNRGQENAARDGRLASFHADAVDFYPESLVFEYGNFETGVKIRWHGDTIDRILASLCERVEEVWLGWSPSMRPLTVHRREIPAPSDSPTLRRPKHSK